ncbi:unnamed protein product, partial [Coregonus sp. 'balchen']
MQRTKLKKNSESTPPSKKTICSITETDSSNVTSNKRSVLGGIENSPLSFDPLSVPETPDSQIRTSHPASRPEGGHLSPICRSPRSKGGSLIRENSPKAAMFSLRSKISPPPQVQTGTKNSSMQRCSVKRLLSPDDVQVVKRPKTIPVKRPFISPLQKSLLHGEDFLSECLQVIGDTQNSKGTKSQQGTGLVGKAVNSRKTSKADQILFEGCSVLTSRAKEKMGNVVPSLKPLSVKRALSLSSNESSLPSSLSECEEECAFTVITEQKDATEYNSCPTDLNTSGGHVISPSCEKPSSVPVRNGKTRLPCPPNPNKSLMEVESSAVRDCGTDGKGVTSSEDHLEGLEDNWFDDKMEESFSNTKKEKSNAGKRKGIPDHVILTTGLHNRYWILDVQEVHGDRGSSTPVSRGDVVHLEGQCVSGIWLIDRESGFLVLLPDVLISGTSIASGIRCMRRAVLGEMFKSFDGGSKQMLNGTIVHEIFQKAAMSGDFSMERLQLLANQALLSPNYLGDMPSDGALSRQDSACSITVTDFVDIEENIWSPRFGLKGKIDVTAGVRIHRRGRPPLNRVMPLELKTGKESNSIEHHSQVILYTLMSLERRSDAEAGFLLYLKTGNMHPIEEGQTRMAPLPGIITDRQACKWCPQIRNCALYDRAVESRAPGYYSSDAQQLLVQQESEHLREAHLLYFSHWLLLCALETHTMERKGGRHNIWLQEKSGGCMGNMHLIGPVKNQSDSVYIHRFERHRGREQGVTGLIVGDRIVVSDHDLRLIGVAAGYVTDVSSTAVSCSLDRDLSKCSSDVVFRLDQDEGVMGLSTHLVNLSKLMESSLPSERLRELIVDFRPPQFIDNLSSVLPREAKDTVANILKGLNKPQKQAMKKVLLSKDYTLIVRILHACGFSVLLTSYTHSAVDNILLKLRRFKVGFLRLGRAQKVHPDILAYTEERCRANGIHTLPELENLYNKELVVATTCMGVKHPIFSRRRFDFCIVDEASQISQPVSLGMDESLFKRLERNCEAVVQLNVQYRMNSKIMSLSNTLMYGGRLECGSERTASAMLTLPSQGSVQRELALGLGRPEDLAWVQAALEPLNPVCFLDTTQVPALETVDKGGISNQTEAALVHGIVSLLLKAGCRASDIGVIAPYRQQLKAISGLLAGPAFSTVEVNTVDKYQGRDKSVIIVSFVRSHPEGNLGELLKDWRRLNVAITRAKHKLLMLPPAAHEVLPIMHLVLRNPEPGGEVSGVEVIARLTARGSNHGDNQTPNPPASVYTEKNCWVWLQG